MTKEEAISLIKSAQLMLVNPKTNEPVSDLYEAFDMAIKELENKPRFLVQSDGKIEQIIESCDDKLDKIRAEIEQMPSELTTDGRRMIRRGSVFRIIDKYRKNDTHDKTCMNCFHNHGVRHNTEFNPEDIVCEYWESDGLTKDDFCSRWKDEERND